MKRFLVTVLSVLYLVSAMGATVEIHYCMGKSVGANFVHKDDDTCRKCGMSKSETKGCCEDKHETFKTSDHQLAKVSFDLPSYAFAIEPRSFDLFLIQEICAPAARIIPLINAPPGLWRTQPIYLMVRNFRI